MPSVLLRQGTIQYHGRTGQLVQLNPQQVKTLDPLGIGANADVLKMYPLRGWQVVLGELLAPAAILTGVQWCLLLLSVTMFSRLPEGDTIPLANRLSIGAGAAIIAPMLNLISLVIPNASVLLFPAWVQIGREHVGGIEVIGQRLIFMLGSVLVFAFALLPAGVLFGLVFFLANLFVGVIVAVPLAARIGRAPSIDAAMPVLRKLRREQAM